MKNRGQVAPKAYTMRMWPKLSLFFPCYLHCNILDHYSCGCWLWIGHVRLCSKIIRPFCKAKLLTGSWSPTDATIKILNYSLLYLNSHVLLYPNSALLPVLNVDSISFPFGSRCGSVWMLASKLANVTLHLFKTPFFSIFAHCRSSPFLFVLVSVTKSIEMNPKLQSRVSSMWFLFGFQIDRALHSSTV